MPRPSGGYAAGFVTPVPSANAAAGIWTPRDLYANRVAGTWPVIGTDTPAFSTVGYTRLWGLTTKSSGLVTGTAATDTGLYNVKWWDNTISNYSSGDTFSKAAAGGYRAFEIYPAAYRAVDSSVLSHAGAIIGSVTSSTAQSKFPGGSSLYFVSGGYISIPSHASFGMGTGDFTIEMFVRPTGSTAVGGLINLGTYNDGLLWRQGTNPDTLYLNGTYVNWNSFTNAPLNEWTHIALVRSGSTVKVYANGIAVLTTSSSANLGSSKAVIIGTGAHALGENFIGYIDDLRVVKGSAVYTANFSPPASALTAISGTSLLLSGGRILVPAGQFDGFDVSSNNITKLRGESLVIDRAPGINSWVYNSNNYTSKPQYFPGPPEFASLKNNDLAAADLNQFYTDLGASNAGRLSVQGNPGIAADTPSIATAKGYTVFGSVPPATTLLLNGEGANNGTTITDSSVTAQTIRRLFASGAGPVTSTTQFKYGSASILFSGNNWLDNTATGNAASALNTENFTIEMWVFLATRGTATPIFDLDSGLLWRVGSSASNLFIGNAGYDWSPSTHVLLTTWTHVALVRENDNIRVYAGGVQRLSITLAANTVIGPNGVIKIGVQANAANHRMTANSYLDDIRLTRGLALYTGTFTPPTAQLTAL